MEPADPGLAHRVLHRYAAGARRRALFVTGWRADGIDWLATRLNRHPRIAMTPGDDVIANRYNPIVRALIGDRDVGGLSADEAAALGATARRATALLERARVDATSGVAYAGSAHYNHAVNLALLAGIFPGARFLWVARDPRAAARAHWAANASAAGDAAAFRGYAERAMHDIAKLVRARDDAARQGAQLLVVRFERLATEPAATLAEIARWLGLDPASDWGDAAGPDARIPDAPDPAALDAAYGRHFPHPAP